VAAWLVALCVAVPSAAWAEDSHGEHVPYVYPMVLLQFLRPVGNPDNAPKMLAKMQQAVTNVLTDLQTARTLVQDAITTLKTVTPATAIAAAKKIATDVSGAITQLQKAITTLQGASPLLLYAIDDQTPFFGKRLGGEEIPWDQVESMVSTALNQGIQQALRGQHTITIPWGNDPRGLPAPTGPIGPCPGIVAVDCTVRVQPGTYTVTIDGVDHSVVASGIELPFDIISKLVDKINAGGHPLTAAGFATSLVTTSKKAWDGTNYSIGVTGNLTIDNNIVVTLCNSPRATYVFNDKSTRVVCSWRAADSSLDVTVDPGVSAGGVPTISLAGKGANKTLNVSFKPHVRVDMSMGAMLDFLKDVPFFENSQSVGASLFVEANLDAEAKNLSLDPVQPDQIFNKDNSLNTNFVTQKLNFTSSNVQLDGLMHAMTALGAEGGAVGGAVLGTVFSGGNPLGTLIGGLVGLIAGAIAGGFSEPMVDDYVQKLVQDALAKEFVKAREQFNTQIANELTKNSSQIQTIKDDITKYQNLYTTISGQLYQYLGITSNKNFQIFNDPNPETQERPTRYSWGHWIDAVRQMFVASVDTQLPAPKGSSVTISGTLSLPAHTCNYKPLGGQGDSQQWTYTIGTAGPDLINADIVGKSCGTIFTQNVQVFAYRGSTPKQMTGGLDAVITPSWTPIPLNVTGKPFAKINEKSGAEYYRCDFTLSGLPSNAIVRFAMKPNSDLVGRLRLDKKGSYAHAQSTDEYNRGDISDLKYAERDFYFRTMLLGPSAGSLTTPIAQTLTTAKQLAQSLGPAGAQFQAPLDDAQKMVQTLAGFTTLDEKGAPATAFAVGYRGVKDQKAECPSMDFSGGSIYNSDGAQLGETQLWYMYGSWE
jgi:uncharacterized membrane protein